MAFHVWQFNVTIEDDMQIVNALKRSLEGRLPQQECPVSVEIAMETLEVIWSFCHGGRCSCVSVLG